MGWWVLGVLWGTLFTILRAPLTIAHGRRRRRRRAFRQPSGPGHTPRAGNPGGSSPARDRCSKHWDQNPAAGLPDGTKEASRTGRHPARRRPQPRPER